MTTGHVETIQIPDLAGFQKLYFSYGVEFEQTQFQSKKELIKLVTLNYRAKLNDKFQRQYLSCPNGSKTALLGE